MSSKRTGVPASDVSIQPGYGTLPARSRNALTWCLPTLLCVLSALAAVPSIITPDGYAYLLGSVVIGTPDMPDYFPWYREPLYPALLWAGRALSASTDVGIVVAQAAALGVGATLTVRAFLPRARRRTVLLLATAIACSPINLGYAGTLLQQAWFLLALAGYTYLIAWTWQARGNKRWLAFLLALPLISLSVHLGQQMVFMAVPLAVGLAGGCLLRQRTPAPATPPGRSTRSTRFTRTPQDSPLTRGLAAVGLAAAAAVGLTAWGSLSLEPWQDYKTQEIAKRGDRALYLTDLGLGLEQVEQLVRGDPLAYLRRLPGDAAAVLSLGPSTYEPLAGARENDIIVAQAFSERSKRCGVGLSAEAGVDVALTQDELEQTCRNGAAHAVLGALMPLGHVLTFASGLLFLLAPVVLLVRRRWRELSLMLVPYAFLAQYVVLNAGIDRYGMPLYPVGLAAAAAALLAGREGRHG